MTRMPALPAALALTFTLACQSASGDFTPEAQAAQADTIRARMESYAAALAARDAERILSHYVQGPEFRLYVDGTLYTYDDMVGVASSMARTLSALEVRWDSVNVTSLGRGAAIAGATFRRVLTDTAGAVSRDRGTASWIWVRRDGQWRSIHGHGVHYAETTPRP